jgi:hypothetical protein
VTPTSRVSPSTLSVSTYQPRLAWSLPPFTMITAGIRRPRASELKRIQYLGTALQTRFANEAGPSTSRNIISGPPISWNALRKGKQRASADIYSEFNLNATTRRSTAEPSSFCIPVQIRHFHVSRPRSALPLIPATAAILKVSLIIRDLAETIVDIHLDRHYLYIPNSYIFLSYRYSGRLSVQTRRKMARRWASASTDDRGGRGVLPHVVQR